MVLVAAIGGLLEPSKARLDSVSMATDPIVAIVTIEHRCGATGLGISPTLFVRVPASAKAVRFVERERTFTQCE